jgi:hypothetical protein
LTALRIHRYSANGVPRTINGALLADCPQCGQLKLKRAALCRACTNLARVGRPIKAVVGEDASRYRARQLCPPSECTYEGCTDDGRQVHHIDGDPFNNDLTNLTRLCPLHHMTVDGRLEAARARVRDLRKYRKDGGRS